MRNKTTKLLLNFILRSTARGKMFPTCLFFYKVILVSYYKRSLTHTPIFVHSTIYHELSENSEKLNLEWEKMERNGNLMYKVDPR